MRRTWPLIVGVCLAAAAVAVAASASAARPADRPAAGQAAGPAESLAESLAGSPRLAGPAGLALPGGPAFPGAAQTTSPNWSGWADVARPGAAMRSVTARFRVPHVSCGADGQSVSIWAGLDGIGDDTVEQAGVEAVCVRTRNGWLAAKYVSFSETYPRAPLVGSFVSPGDLIAVSVFYAGGTHRYRLSLTDNRSAWADISVSAACPRGRTCHNASAEVVAEDSGDGPASGSYLADFGKVSFDGIGVSSSDGTRGTLGTLAGSARWSTREITMEYRGQVMAQPSARTHGYTRFGDSYQGTG